MHPSLGTRPICLIFSYHYVFLPASSQAEVIFYTFSRIETEKGAFLKTLQLIMQHKLWNLIIEALRSLWVNGATIEACKTSFCECDPITLVERYLCSWILFETRSHCCFSSLLIRTHYKFVVRQSFLIWFERRNEKTSEPESKRSASEKSFFPPASIELHNVSLFIASRHKNLLHFFASFRYFYAAKEASEVSSSSFSFKRAYEKALSNLIKIWKLVFSKRSLLPITLAFVSREFRFCSRKETKRDNLWLEWSPSTISPLFLPFSASEACERRSSERQETQSSNKFNARLLQNDSWPRPLGKLHTKRCILFCFLSVFVTMATIGSWKNVFVIIFPRKARLELIKGWKCQSRDNKSSLCYH